MLAVVEAAAALGDARVAAEAYELLRPYADLPMTASVAVSCFGSTERALGLAALTAGRPDAAVRHLDRAVAANARLGHRPMTAVSRADLAVALRRRGAPGDRDRAAALLAAAAVEADGLDLPVRAPGLAGARRGRRPGAGPPGAAALGSQLGRPAGGGRATWSACGTWPGCWPGRARRCPRWSWPRTRPRSPGRTGSRCSTGGPAGRTRTAPAGWSPSWPTPASGPTAAEWRCWSGRRTRSPMSWVARPGLGRTRDFPDPAERARTAVRKAIKRAVAAVTAADPAIGAELRATVTTGSACAYTPPVRRTAASRT